MALNLIDSNDISVSQTGSNIQLEIAKKPVVLFNNASGDNGEITLSDSSANYNYLEIYFKQQDNTYSFTRVADPNGKAVILMGYHITNNGYAIGISARNVLISTNKIITQPTNRYMKSNIVSTDVISGGSVANDIYITKVVGYK